MKILLIRNDKLGDFILAWPAVALLKHYLPDCHITMLLPPYTAALAPLSTMIDAVLIDSGQGVWALQRQLREQRFDAVITLFSTGRVALATALARIPYRLAPATKWAQLLYNQRLTQRRSRSLKPEYAYNCDLVDRFLRDIGLQPASESADEWLPSELQRPLLRYAAVMKTDTTVKTVVIHPGSGGSAGRLPPPHYAALVRAIATKWPVQIWLTAGSPDEQQLAQQLAALLPKLSSQVVMPADLPQLVALLAGADLFIGSSSGPLHLAGALNSATIAFYPGHRSATPLRWQSLNSADRRLHFTPPAAAEQQVAAIDMAAATRAALDFLQRLWG
ncbi:lipopolysaccharide heptosyltransferase family protein [Ectothiorhodospiraceae bacterium BW-2]|nr:lipopolysaccharide heptosyltransferase family protein [Ectothiorhodospiraceae bacterium BW-2]